MRIQSIVLAGLIAAAGLAAQDLNQGVQLYESRKYADAERVLRQVAGAEPENAEVRQYLGLALLEQNKLSEAESALQKAIELAPDLERAKLGLVRVYIQQKQIDKAQAALDGANISEDTPDLPLYRGMINVSKGNHKAAAADLETAIQRKPDNAYAHYYAGLAYNGLKRPDKMVERFETFLRLAPDAPEAAKVRSLLRSVR